MFFVQKNVGQKEVQKSEESANIAIKPLWDLGVNYCVKSFVLKNVIQKKNYKNFKILKF